MSPQDLTRTLWRRKWLIILIAVIATATTYVIASALPKVYSATARIAVISTADNASELEEFQLPRTFISLISSGKAAEEVIDRLSLDDTPAGLLDKVSFAPVQDTTLVSVSAEGESAEGTARLANGYAFWAMRYVEETLKDSAQGKSGVTNFALPPPIRCAQSRRSMPE